MNHWRFILVIGLLAIVQSLAANPLPVYLERGGPEDLALWKQAVVVCFSLAMECIALILLLRSVSEARISVVLKAFFLVHLISYPTTLLLAKPLGLTSEVFPLVFEPWLFAQVSGLTFRDSWKAVLRSNLLSFLLGISIPQVWVKLFPFYLGGFNAS